MPAVSKLISAFVSTRQGKFALAVSVAYMTGMLLWGLAPVFAASNVVKLALYIYAINCTVSGKCHSMAWVYVALLTCVCAADLMIMVHLTRLNTQSYIVLV